MCSGATRLAFSGMALCGLLGALKSPRAPGDGSLLLASGIGRMCMDNQQLLSA